MQFRLRRGFVLRVLIHFWFRGLVRVLFRLPTHMLVDGFPVQLLTVPTAVINLLASGALHSSSFMARQSLALALDGLGSDDLLEGGFRFQRQPLGEEGSEALRCGDIMHNVYLPDNIFSLYGLQWNGARPHARGLLHLSIHSLCLLQLVNWVAPSTDTLVLCSVFLLAQLTAVVHDLAVFATLEGCSLLGMHLTIRARASINWCQGHTPGFRAEGRRLLLLRHHSTPWHTAVTFLNMHFCLGGTSSWFFFRNLNGSTRNDSHSCGSLRVRDKLSCGRNSQRFT